jgi:purine-binding chemotaxis protein CheW
MHGKAISMLSMMSGAGIAAIPISHVLEVLRPLPVNRVAGLPPFVAGLSVIRGHATPVISLSLLMNQDDGEATRFVLLRLDGARQVALAVSRVMGIAAIDPGALHDTPPLIRNDGNDCIQQIGSLDSHLLLVINSMRLLPAEALEALARHEAPPS